jgi:hypothetical protein
MASKLTDKVIRSLEPPVSGNYIVYDDPNEGVGGFGIRITSKGARSFVLNYRFNDPRAYRKSNEWRYTIGRYPAWSLAAAREEAKSLRQKLDRGEQHPVAERQAARRQAKENQDAETYKDAVEYCIDREVTRRKQLRSAK